MFFTAITGIILAVLSLPFIVYAGERTIKRLPRPEFVRSLSESVVVRLRRGSSAQSMGEASSSRSVPTSPVMERRDTNLDRVMRSETGFSVSSGETYVRGMTLEKVGLD